jgi:hypothetical protein
MRARERRYDRPSADSPGPASDAFASTLGQADVDVSLRSVVEEEPAGTGVEEATSSGSFVELASIEIPADRQAQLDEVSASIEANGEAFVAMRGLTFGPYTGKIEISVPFDGAVLLEGDEVVVYHRSTDGNATSSKGQITARLF